MSKNYTERFIVLPIRITYGWMEKEKELRGEENAQKKSDFLLKKLRILPTQIESYHESMWDDESPRVFVQTKSGDEFSVDLPMDEFENRLNKFEAYA